MEVDSKDSEIEQLTQKLASASADTVSNISSGAENDSEEGVQVRQAFLSVFYRFDTITFHSTGFVGRGVALDPDEEHPTPRLAQTVRRRLVEEDILL